MVRLNLVYYGPHTPAVDLRIIRVCPEYFIANPAHGLWGEKNGYGTAPLLRNVGAYQEAGIKVIGYLTGGYEAKGSGSGMEVKWYTLEMNQKLIQNMAELDQVDGIFIDECSAFPDDEAKAYLKTLTDLAHRYGLITWGNVGQDDFDPWFFTSGAFDMMKSSELWRGQTLNSVQEKWGSRLSVTGFRPEYLAEDATRLTLDAWGKGLGYCYITNIEYMALSSWFEEYVKLLREHSLP